MSTGWRANLRPSLAGLTVYDVPRANARARLHANECAEPWPDEVMADLANVVRSVELGRYPDTSGRELREVLAARHGCSTGRVVLGNGSDEVISLLLTALGGASRPVLVIPAPTFIMYAHSAAVLGYEIREVLLDEQLQLDEAALDRALGGATICFFARPNNPTGTLWNADVIDRLVHAHPSVVFVVDEAYVAYAPGASLWSRLAADNVVHMHTLSKIGLAALRVGYAIAQADLALALDKVRHPYNVSQTSIAIAKAVLERHGAAMQTMVERTIENRARLTTILRRVPRTTVFDSAANFVVARLAGEGRSRALAVALAGAGIMVKDTGALPRLSGCLRVGVGTASELDVLESVLASWRASDGG